MTGHPLVLGDEDVREILAGRKTTLCEPTQYYFPYETPQPIRNEHADVVVGDTFWVREFFAPRQGEDGDDTNQHYVQYRADGDPARSPSDPMDWHKWEDGWRQPVEMPLWACRLLLIVTDVQTMLGDEGTITFGFAIQKRLD
jgi:hypothetical protein